MAAVTVHSYLGIQEKKICCCFHFFPSTCHEVIGPDAIILLLMSLLLLNSPLFCTQGRSLTGRRLGVPFTDVQHWLIKDVCNEMISPLRHGTFNSFTMKNWFFWTVVLEKTLEGPLDSKKIPPVNSIGNWCWIFTGRTNAEAQAPILSATWWEEPTHWKRPWYWERVRAREEVVTGWDNWMASPTQWTWVWANSGR